MTQDESPPPEPAESAAKVVSQQPSSHLVGDTRKKKFAPKVKTGCNTCRFVMVSNAEVVARGGSLCPFHNATNQSHGQNANLNMVLQSSPREMR